MIITNVSLQDAFNNLLAELPEETDTFDCSGLSSAQWYAQDVLPEFRNLFEVLGNPKTDKNLRKKFQLLGYALVYQNGEKVTEEMLTRIREFSEDMLSTEYTIICTATYKGMSYSHSTRAFHVRGINPSNAASKAEELPAYKEWQSYNTDSIFRTVARIEGTHEVV